MASKTTKGREVGMETIYIINTPTINVTLLYREGEVEDYDMLDSPKEVNGDRGIKLDMPMRRTEKV